MPIDERILQGRIMGGRGPFAEGRRGCQRDAEQVKETNKGHTNSICRGAPNGHDPALGFWQIAL